MDVIERRILSKLIEVAHEQGFKCVRFAEQPGEPDDAVLDPTLDDCIAFADAVCADSIIEFKGERTEFWVLLVWGNGEDVISDYVDTPEANAVVDAVYAWQEGGR